MYRLRVLMAVCVLVFASLVSCGSSSDSDLDSSRYRKTKEITNNTDGTVSSYKVLIYGACSTTESFEYQEYDGTGADGQWFTSDDKCITYYKWERNPDGTPTFGYYWNVGSDGKIGTSDDSKDTDYDKFTCSDGKVIKCETYVGSSIDTTNLYEYSGDDLVKKLSASTISSNTLYYQYTRNDDGFIVKTETKKLGADKTWGTADDIPDRTTTFTYDGKLWVNSETVNDSNIKVSAAVTEKQADGSYLIRSSTGAGSDLVWFTSDDIYYTGYCITTFDSNGYTTKELVMITGSDGIIGSADDFLNSISTYEYEEY